MLTGFRIYSSDCTWRRILSDLGAFVLDAPTPTDLNLDDIDISTPVSPLELKTLLLNASDYGGILKKILPSPISLPRLQAQIVVLLYRSGGMSVPQLKTALGYAPDVATHTVDNAIYQLRRTFGHDFILNSNGVYRLGKL